MILSLKVVFKGKSKRRRQLYAVTFIEVSRRVHRFKTEMHKVSVKEKTNTLILR